VESVLSIEDHLFREFVERRQHDGGYYDVVFQLGNGVEIRANRALLALGSEYFKVLVLGNYQEQREKKIVIPFSDSVLFEVMLNYIYTGFVVVSKEYGH
jgi:hypothetical protein